MVVFLDQYDNEYGAQATLQVTNAVNGERSLKGTIVTNDDVLNTIEKGWKMQFDDEYYRIIYAEPVDLGNKKQVEFDAVHQFFYDFDKSSAHSQLADGSHTFETYLNFIFDGSGYTYRLEVDVKAFEKQSFGYKSRLSLFNDIITQAGVEFSVSGKVVRILKNVGTDLSTIVRKNFNMDDLKLKKNINGFITYQKGFGVWNDENDHSKGRLEVEYESPLAKEYGRIEGEPVVDERYKVAENLKEVLKKNVESSYTVSVELTMEDLTKAGYKYQQPVAGDYIMAINEALGFRERIRIVSFTSEYDVTGKLLNHKVTCNDIGQVKKQSASYSNLSKQVSSNQNELSELAKIANRALVSADGKNTNYYGTTMPVDSPKGTLKKGDLLFLTVGDVTKQYVWNGSEWIINPYSEDIDWVKTHIEEDIKPQLVQMDEDIKATDQKVKDALAQIGEQADIVETNKLATKQAQADATRAIQDAQTVAGQLDSAKTSLQTEIDQAKQVATTVAGQLDSAKSDLQAAITAADKKAVDANTSISQTRNELNAQASQLNAQAQVQTDLTKRMSSVETLADGTRTSLNELSKTVGQNGKDLASVTSRTKTVEDTLAGTKTKLEQVSTALDGATGDIVAVSRKTADLESGLNGVNSKFEKLSIGGRNLLRGTRNFDGSAWDYALNRKITVDWRPDDFGVIRANYPWEGVAQPVRVEAGKTYTFSFDVASAAKNTPFLSLIELERQSVEVDVNVKTFTADEYFQRYHHTFTARGNGVVYPRVETSDSQVIYYRAFKVEKGNVATDYSEADEDFHQQIAEYKQTAEQNLANLSSTVRALDGTVTQNKTSQEQTASEFKSRLTSLETYKDSEVTRAKQYFESAKTETARQLTAERTAIAKDYVAKSTYTEDVSGIHNDLTATTMTANTTKTNLANYQTSNDKAAANLQSNLQTANGNISSLQTKIEAVPGQITSAVSAVEGKIPTNLDSLNLMTGTRDWSTKTKAWHMGPYWSTESEEYQGLKVHSTQKGYNGSHQNIFVKNGDVVTFSFFAKATNTLSKIKVSSRWSGSSVYQAPLAGVKESDEKITITSEWKRYSKTIHITSDGSLQFRTEYEGSTIPDGNTFYIAGLKVAKSAIDTGYSENPTDLASDITKLSSEIKQTVSKVTSTIGDSTAISRTVQSALVGLQEYKNLTSGLSTVQSQMAGSWAVKNLNASGDVLSQLNLNNGNVKIDGKLVRITGTTVIDDAVITSAMLKEVSADKVTSGTFDANKVNVINLNANKIVGLDAAFIKAKIGNALIDWLKGKVIQSQNGNTKLNLMNGRLYTSDDNAGIFRVDDNASTMGLKFVNTNTTINGNARKVSRVIIGGDRRAGSSDADFGWDRGGFTGIVMSTIKGEASDVSWENDDIQLVGDRVVFTHSYYDDTDATGARTGWQMYNYVGTSPRQSYVNLRPYNIANNLSILDVGDVRLWVNGSQEYSLRTALNKLKAVFVHIKNGGFSDSARNAIINTLNEMDGMKI